MSLERACVVMADPFDPLAKLKANRDKLAALTPYPWEPVKAWINGVRPLIRAHFSAHQADFEACAKDPRWAQPIYVASTSRSGQRRDNFASADASPLQENTKLASGAVAGLLSFVDGVLELPLAPTTAPAASASAVQTVHGPQYNFTNSPFGAGAFGAGSTATGQMTISPSTLITKEMLKEAIGELQTGLVKVQDRLEEMDARVYDFLSQLLVNVRRLQFEQAEIATIQARVKDTMDEAWAKDAAKAMKPQLLPRVIEGVKLLKVAQNPIAQELVKGLLESAG
jgi:hypothetical protein